MMATISESPLARKIRALMAKANDKSVTEHEAAAYAAKVQELLVKNGLSMDSVKQDEAEDAPVGAQKFKEVWKSPARKLLLRAVCKYYMCEAIGPAHAGGAWTILGRPHNVVVAIEMTDYLIKTVIRLSGQYGRANIGSNIIDFRKGAMIRLAERLHEATEAAKAAKQEYKVNGNPGNLPALFVSEATAIAAIKKRMGTVPSKGRAIKAGLRDSEAGRAAGNGISLHGQVGKAASGRLMIGN